MKTKTATEKRERPIIFSSEMVRQILSGNKTQTRRVVKSPKSFGEFRDVFDDDYLTSHGFIAIDTSIGHGFKIRCPYGKIGDSLWVREAFMEKVDIGLGHNFYQYKATPDNWQFAPNLGDKVWRPSVFMPREASRLTLEITNIKVERLQDITEAGAQAEGIKPTCKTINSYSPTTARAQEHTETIPAKENFKVLWDKINGKREGCSWSDNPFVWVVEFKKV